MSRILSSGACFPTSPFPSPQFLLSLSFGLLSLLSFVGAVSAEEPAERMDSAPADNVGTQPGLSLTDCLQTAIEHNYDIKQAKERINKQYHVKLEARAGFLPTLGVDGTLDYTDSDRLDVLGDAPFFSEKFWTVNVRAEQYLYAGGRNAAAFRRGKFLEEAAREDLAAVISDVVYRVREAYFNVLLAHSELKVQQQNVGLFDEQLKNENSRLKVGMVSDFDVLRAEVNLANSQTPFIRARNQVKLSWEELRRVIGVGDMNDDGASLPTHLSGELVFEPYAIALDEAIKKAEEHRPELRRAKLTVEAEKEGVEVQRADYFPVWSVFASYGADKSRFTDDLDDEHHGWIAGTTANWNLFDGLATTSRVNQAESTLSEARIRQAQLRQDINVEVRRLHSSFIETAELVKASTKVVESATEALRLAEARYSTGTIAYVDLLDSQRALTQARTNHVQALHDYNLSVAALKRAMGEISQENGLIAKR